MKACSYHLSPLDQAVCPSLPPLDPADGSYTFASPNVVAVRPHQGTVVNVTCLGRKVPREGIRLAQCVEGGVWFPVTPGCGGKDFFCFVKLGGVRHDTHIKCFLGFFLVYCMVGK